MHARNRRQLSLNTLHVNAAPRLTGRSVRRPSRSATAATATALLPPSALLPTLVSTPPRSQHIAPSSWRWRRHIASGIQSNMGCSSYCPRRHSLASVHCNRWQREHGRRLLHWAGQIVANSTHIPMNATCSRTADILE